MSLALVPATEADLPAGITEHLDDRRGEIASKERQISAVEADLARLSAEAGKLSGLIAENRRLFAMPEPQAVDFAAVDEWHTSLRQYRDDRARLDRELTPLEAGLTAKINDMAAARRRGHELRIEHARLEHDLAKDEHVLAQRRVAELEVRVRRLGVALSVAQQAAFDERRNA